MLWLLVLSVVAGIFAAPSHTTIGTTPNLNALFSQAFKLIDTDGNGHIEVSEFLGIFDKFDSNHDGKMSISEYMQNTQADMTFATEVYKVIDNDNDGLIPRGDMSRIFKLYDTNNNGLISLHEFISEYKKIYQAIIKDLGYFPVGPTLPVPTV